ncbi:MULTISPECIES: penicillin acylase family protein [unclassified Massilia]|uniref:penicillin acylase family protein n=1 Tax=unclassified Massilia TaxID=2609279 RepID=UPI0017857168|nr:MULTISPECIES: penicillin acylase family protein [unclassified Massilia]MBD8532244.1 penicillin acylase family protein [Massilia sp. CFBP 13647]MBD8675681.1 penicillin acylase family protein [Massilia sp. CFBP 13721]
MHAGRWKTWTRRLAFALAGFILLTALAAWLLLCASLAQLDGERRAPALVAPVTVARDAAGVPLIRGNNRFDLAYATGFVHAQERYFQMDLLRRTAAGELAALFGPRALPLDRARRLHRFRARAVRVLASMPPQDRLFIDRYVAGVNAGVDALGARPFEYLLTGSAPLPWRAEDSLLAVWAMFIDLQGNQAPRELARGWLRARSDAAQLAFLLPTASRWDAPLDNAVAPPDAPVPATAPEWWGTAPTRPASLALRERTELVGSNNYAIAGSRSTTGAAIVADDMHLGLQLPNIWYRLALAYPDGQGRERRLVGVTLPGAPPLVIAGSNGKVAWGFTNSYGDYLDLVEVRFDRARPGEVRTPRGWERPAEYVETIEVKGAAAERLVVRETAFGPLRAAGGATYALHWVAHDPGALNLNHLRLEEADTVEAALAIAAVDGIPAQNFVAGDSAGNIGWTIAGRLPLRASVASAADASFPLQSGAPTPPWDGLLAPEQYPRVLNPPDGQLSTANSRQLLGLAGKLVGDGGFDLGARSSQLRDRLRALGARTDEAGAFAVALDDRALFIAGWRARALAVLDPAALQRHPRRAAFRHLLETSWSGRADTASVGYRLARDFMWALHDLCFDGVDAQLAALDPKATMALANPRWPAVVARLLDEQPPGWLPPGQRNWRDVQLAAVDRVIAELEHTGIPLEQATWGARNTAAIVHPIALAMPALGTWLGVPPDQLAGDAHMPRVAGPKFGQSERMTVSPGREEAGLYNMPGGQSGHPLSPYFRHGHDEWVRARALPLLPGPARHTLTLTP